MKPGKILNIVLSQKSNKYWEKQHILIPRRLDGSNVCMSPNDTFHLLSVIFSKTTRLLWCFVVESQFCHVCTWLGQEKYLFMFQTKQHCLASNLPDVPTLLWSRTIWFTWHLAHKKKKSVLTCGFSMDTNSGILNKVLPSLPPLQS